MRLTDVDLNDLLPIYAQGTPIANAIGEAVASAIGGIFGRCESLPCEASRVACDAMRDDELDRVAQDLQIVIYDPAASHEEKARFVYEFAGTRFTAGTYANLKKGLSIFAKIPEWDVSILRESTWRYYIQLANPPAVSLERQRMMERLIPKAHRAVLGFDGMDIHYGNEGESRLFTPAGNACADTLVKGQALTRARHALIARQVRDPADTNTCEIEPAEGAIVDVDARLLARPYLLSQAGGDYDGDIYMREDDLTAAMANCYIARKNVHGGVVGDELRYQYDYTPEPNFRFGDSDFVIYINPPFMFRDAISPLPVFGIYNRVLASDLIASACYADMKIDEQAMNAACKYKARRYCVGFSTDLLALLGGEIHDNLDYYIQGVFAGEYPELFGAFLKVPHQFASLQAWGEAYAQGQPSASETWCDTVDGFDATRYWNVFDHIEIVRDNMSASKRLKELTLKQWYSFLIPYPREWA